MSYKGTCHVILLAKLHDMYLYKTTTFPHQLLRSISKLAVLHRFYCILQVDIEGPDQTAWMHRLHWTFVVSISHEIFSCSLAYTVFDLINAHTPISAQSSNITASIFSLYFFTKAYVVGTHLNCIDLSMQFK